MWRQVLLLLSLAGAAAAAWSLYTRGPATEVVAFGRILAVVGLLALAVLVPVLIDLREDARKIPWRDAARVLGREGPIGAAFLMMLAAAAAIALFPFGSAVSTLAWLGLLAVSVVGVAAATLQQLWGYVEPEPVFVEVGGALDIHA